MAGKQNNGLQLLDFWVSPFTQRCRIGLAEKGLAYEPLEQDLLGNKSELLLRSNPVHKKVPVLLHGGRPPVCESLIILQYLDEAFPEAPPLLPSDPGARAHARFWADFADRKVFDCGTRLWQLKGEPQAQARADMVDALRTLDAELGDKPYLAGDAFGFLDIAVVPFSTWLLTYQRLAEFSVEEVCPRLVAWGKRCAERESVARNLQPPEDVYGFICHLMTKLDNK